MFGGKSNTLAQALSRGIRAQARQVSRTPQNTPIAGVGQADPENQALATTSAASSLSISPGPAGPVTQSLHRRNPHFVAESPAVGHLTAADPFEADNWRSLVRHYKKEADKDKASLDALVNGFQVVRGEARALRAMINGLQSALDGSDGDKDLQNEIGQATEMLANSRRWLVERNELIQTQRRNFLAANVKLASAKESLANARGQQSSADVDTEPSQTPQLATIEEMREELQALEIQISGVENDRCGAEFEHRNAVGASNRVSEEIRDLVRASASIDMSRQGSSQLVENMRGAYTKLVQRQDRIDSRLQSLKGFIDRYSAERVRLLSERDHIRGQLLAASESPARPERPERPERPIGINLQPRPQVPQISRMRNMPVRQQPQVPRFLINNQQDNHGAAAAPASVLHDNFDAQMEYASRVSLETYQQEQRQLDAQGVQLQGVILNSLQAHQIGAAAPDYNFDDQTEKALAASWVTYKNEERRRQGFPPSVYRGGILNAVQECGIEPRVRNDQYEEHLQAAIELSKQTAVEDDQRRELDRRQRIVAGRAMFEGGVGMSDEEVLMELQYLENQVD